jgi:hypothetical protein
LSRKVKPKADIIVKCVSIIYIQHSISAFQIIYCIEYICHHNNYFIKKYRCYLFYSFIYSLFYHIHHEVWLWLTTVLTLYITCLARKLIEQTQVDLRAGIVIFFINYQVLGKGRGLTANAIYLQVFKF